MRKSLLMFIIIIFAACQSDNECIINGQVQDIEDGTQLYLMRRNGQKYSVSDTITVKDGKFSLKITYNDKNAQAEEATILLDNRATKRFGMLNNIYIAPDGKVSITGRSDEIYTWQVDSDIPHQIYFNLLTADSRHYTIEYERLHAMAQLGFMRTNNVKVEEYETAKQLRDSIFSTIYPQMFAYVDSSAIAEMEAMRTLSVNEIWIKRLLEYSGSVELSKRFAHGGKEYPSYVNDLKLLYERMTPEQKATTQGKKIEKYLYPLKALQVGDILYDTDLYDLHGKCHRLADYRGKYLLIDFWRASCAHCLKSIPEMRRLAEEWKDALHIISISSDDKEVWHNVSNKENITWTNLNDMQNTTGIFAHYGVTGVPHYVLASPEGKIIHTWAGYGTGLIEKKLKEWIK